MHTRTATQPRLQARVQPTRPPACMPARPAGWTLRAALRRVWLPVWCAAGNPPHVLVPSRRSTTKTSARGAAGGNSGGGGVEAEPAGKDFWAVKPWWCQPWSILLTGSVAVAASWAVLHIWWVTAPVTLGVLSWWYLFLLLVPSAYAEGSVPQQVDVDPE